MIVVILPLFLLISYLTLDEVIRRRARSKIDLVIHVNGTRGKSSVVRLLDQAFRSQGYRTCSKVTGTYPVYRDVGGNQVDIKRIAPLIREQRRYLKKAASERAEVYIVECMAITPELQGISESYLQADLAIITNSRYDHLEIMGRSRETIADSLFKMTRKKQPLIVGEEFLYRRFEGLHHNLTMAPHQDPVKGEFCENTNLVFAAAAYAGLDGGVVRDALTPETSLASRVHQDLSNQRINEWGNCRLFNGFSANDLDSTIALYDEYLRLGDNIIWYNHRADRPVRGQLFLRWMVRTGAETVIITGDNYRKNCRTLRALGYSGQIFSSESWGDKDRTIFGMGNILGLENILGDHYV